MKHPFIYCIGFRNGSQSMWGALKRFGYRPYTMQECVRWYSHANAWYYHAAGRRKADIPALLDGYDAAAGQPCMFFPEDILAAFPDALVIINTREPSAWFRSFRNFAVMISKVRRILWFVPRLRAIYRQVEAMTFKGCFAGRIDDQAHCLAKLEELHVRAGKLIPPGRILVFDVTEGWKPLCDFLKVPVPDEPFPHLNRKEFIVKTRIGLSILKDMCWFGLAVFVVVKYGLSWISAAALAAEAGVWLLLYRLRRV